jgi:hypothetical protein
MPTSPSAGAHGAAIAETSDDVDAGDHRHAADDGRRPDAVLHRFRRRLLRTNQGPAHAGHRRGPPLRAAGPGEPTRRSGAMLHAANNLVSLGRGIGLRIVLISQRPAKLHKDSLTQVETLVAMRLIAPQDRGDRGLDQANGRILARARDHRVAAVDADRRCVDLVAADRRPRSRPLPARPHLRQRQGAPLAGRLAPRLRRQGHHASPSAPCARRPANSALAMSSAKR